MKKLFVCFVISMVAFVANAQKHLSFMGIPLNGSITTFQQKLAAKNILPDKKLNATNPVGFKFFNGSFSGYKSEIIVYYNEKSKNVYRGKACIYENSEGITLDRYEEFKRLLGEKYKSSTSIEDTKDGYFTYHILVTDDKDKDIILGEIDLYIGKLELVPGSYNYSLHIDYIDFANQNKNKDEKMYDL